nr:RDD family protein [Micromonospora maritima]
MTGPPTSRRTSPWTRPPRPRCCGSAAPSTACPWRWNWPRPGWAPYPWRRWRRGWTTGSGCCAAATGRRSPDTGRWRRWWSGAGTCWASRSGDWPPGWACSPAPPTCPRCRRWPGRPPAPRPHGLPLASYGSRLVARLIDFGVVFLLNAVVNGWFVWRYFEAISPYLRESMRRALNGDTSTEGLPQIDEQAGGLQIAILLIATALWYAYEVPSMAARGQTFGKRVMGVRAVPIEADQPLGFGRATRRWSTMGLPTLLWYCCGLGLLLQFVDAVSPLFDQPLRQALHDKRAQTVVVQLPRDRTDPRTAPRDRADPPGDTP